jgi:hypothetical protein
MKDVKVANTSGSVSAKKNAWVLDHKKFYESIFHRRANVREEGPLNP